MAMTSGSPGVNVVCQDCGFVFAVQPDPEFPDLVPHVLHADTINGIGHKTDWLNAYKQALREARR